MQEGVENGLDVAEPSRRMKRRKMERDAAEAAQFEDDEFETAVDLINEHEELQAAKDALEQRELDDQRDAMQALEAHHAALGQQASLDEADVLLAAFEAAAAPLR